MTLRIGINGKEFDIIIVLRRNYLSNEKERINRTIYYQCKEWRDLQGEAGAKMINVISQVEKVLSGEEYDAEIQKRQLGMETAQQAIEYLQTQVGNGFPKQAELEAAEEHIAELEEQMKVELAAIEAQEETDKSETATIDIDPDELIDDNAGNGLRFRDGGNLFGSDAPASDAELARRVRRIARTLNTPVEIIDDLDAITDSDPLMQRRKRRSKGFYDPQTGQTFIVLPNITTLADAEATVLHEIVGHMGLRSLMGDRFGDFLDKVYNGLDTEGHSRVTDIAREQEHQSSGAKHRRTDTRRLATEEYLAHLAEGDITPSRFARIIGRIRSLLRDILRLPLRIGDRDIAYLLWLSKHRLQKHARPPKPSPQQRPNDASVNSFSVVLKTCVTVRYSTTLHPKISNGIASNATSASIISPELYSANIMPMTSLCVYMDCLMTWAEPSLTAWAMIV